MAMNILKDLKGSFRKTIYNDESSKFVIKNKNA